MENIIAALISAVTAIVVALISRMPTKTGTGVRVPRLKGTSHGKWVVAIFLIATWLVISPIAIHHDFPGVNMFALFVLTAIVALVFPINGWEAAAWIFALHALNSVCEPISRIAERNPYPAFSGYNPRLLFFFTAVAMVNALGVGFLSQWRLRRSLRGASLTMEGHTTSVENPSVTAQSEAPRNASGSDPDFSVQLERLARLRESGSLSEAEFIKAKKRILGGLDPNFDLSERR